ncbi:hypothetical protein [Streptomyces sp. NPDC097619]|uniref:hypothetical protein n=1 Tax=Streptomyces sp. NPDC097619 TaxID=3157228 RepID=UPI003331FB17
MTWDSVPWFVEGGAEHSSEVARLLAFASFGGAEGIVGSTSLQVKSLSAPAARIQVRHGACAILDRSDGSSYQAYAARTINNDEVAVAATGPAARSDLVIARIENPYTYGETWPNPQNPAVGPYVHTRILSGVPKTTTSVRQIRPQDSAITLARIDIPPNTNAITQAMIRDLRQMVNPRQDRRLYTTSPLGDQTWPGNSKGTWVAWPPMARWTIEVPPWAVRARIRMDILGTQVIGGGVWGACAWKLGSSVQGQSVQIDTARSDGSQRINMMSADTVRIPPAMRGTVQTLSALVQLDSNNAGILQADVVTTGVADVQWVEDPDEDET